MSERTSIDIQARHAQVRPLLFSSGILRGEKLILRGHEAAIEVRAPARFLRALMNECDGTRTVAELVAQMERRAGQSSFGKFLEAMLDQGILIDVSIRYLHVWTDPATTPPAEASMHPKPGTGEYQYSRMSNVSNPVSAMQATDLLNALSERRIGVALADDASAERAIEGRLLLVGDSPGTDEMLSVVRLDSASGLRMRAASQGKWADVFRAIGDPYEMRRAVAVVVLVANCEDGASTWASADRARQAFLLAGAALQRAAVSAAAQAWELHSVGSFDCGRLGLLCEVPAQTVLACAILRIPDNISEKSSAAETPLPVQLQWVSSGPRDDQGHVVRATVAPGADRGGIGWGRHRDPRVACAIAISEIAERHSYREITKPLAYCRGFDLEHHADPRSLVQFSGSQYLDPAQGVVPYSDQVPRYWVEAVDVNAEASIWLPADCVFHAGCLPQDAKAQLLMKSTSSGCASDICAETALQRAAHELIERDALMRHWLAQRSGRPMSISSLPGHFGGRVAQLNAMGLELDISVLEASLGPVMVVGLTSVSHGFCSIGASSGDCPASTLEHALSEAEAAAMVRVRYRPKAMMDVKSVRTPDDHGNLFAQPRHFRRAHALLRGGAAPAAFSDIEGRWPSRLEERLRRPQGSACLYSVELTAPDAPLSLNGSRIRTIRALIPGALPIAFGHDAVPLGMGAPVVRAGRFPHPLS